MVQLASADINKDSGKREKIYYINDLKRRSKTRVTVPVLLLSPVGDHDFYKTYTGALETTVKYKEFYTSTDLRN